MIAAIGAADAAAQQPPPAPSDELDVQPFVRNLTRYELWRYFEPLSSPTAGNPDSDHIGNRLTAGVRLRQGMFDATVALQYVQFGGLPANAIGPGALGTGALYYDHSGDTASRQLYLKAANVAFRKIGGGLDVQVGRMPYTSGAERASGVPKIEAVKRSRIDSRLVGEFEWSLYQRAYDGVRADWAGKSFQATGTVFRPTQGGFEDAAGVGIDDITVISGVVTTAPGVVVPSSELQVFVHRYDDERDVTARPDNTGHPAAHVDVAMTTFGAHLVGAGATDWGQADWLVWIAAQTGSWYELDHRGLAWSLEAGHQWPQAAWSPWVRGGYSWHSGDDDPADGTHGTFFPMLPTVRRFSQSTLYSLANLRDVFAQAIVRPRANVTARIDVHSISLEAPEDGWYAGSGATQEEGRIFGYTLRPGGGARGLSDVLEASVDWRLGSHWSVNAYVARASRGPVVANLFGDRSATFFYLENVVQF